jgi:hypothetical protein
LILIALLYIFIFIFFRIFLFHHHFQPNDHLISAWYWYYIQELGYWDYINEEFHHCWFLRCQNEIIK